MNRIIAVTGPTASGKSSLALKIAEKYDCEIVSCDSMQIYRHLDIGTAKPTKSELRLVPHHMIDIADCRDNFSAADYAKTASEAIRDILNRGKIPIICGGTGMYLDALLRPVSFTTEQSESEIGIIRNKLSAFVEKEGPYALHARLREVDPDSADAIHPNNIKRVIRALEIYYLTGKTKTEHDAESRKGTGPYDVFFVNLHYEDREVLYRRINARTDRMIADGLENEVRNLISSGELTKDSTAGQAIGYKEFFDYIDGKTSLIDTIENIKKNTRNYAKRQMTWFSRYRPYTEMTADTTADDILLRTENDIISFLNK